MTDTKLFRLIPKCNIFQETTFEFIKPTAASGNNAGLPNPQNITKPLKKFLNKLMLGIGITLIRTYLWLVQATAKITVLGEHIPDQLQADGHGHLFVFWHNRQFILPLLRPNDTVHCLISDSRDGDYMAALIPHFNKQAIRGSSSRNGLISMKNIMRELHKGHPVGIATDGPRGPAFQVKPGIVQIAQATGKPIIPVSFDASNKKVLDSWDRTYLLFPFGKIAIVYGPPIRVEAEEAVDTACERVRLGLLAAAEQASTMVRSDNRDNPVDS